MLADNYSCPGTFFAGGSGGTDAVSSTTETVRSTPFLYLETEESELNLNRSDLAMHAAKHDSFILMDVDIALKRLIDLVPSLHSVAMLMDEVRQSFIPQIPNNNLTFEEWD